MKTVAKTISRKRLQDELDWFIGADWTCISADITLLRIAEKRKDLERVRKHARSLLDMCTRAEVHQSIRKGLNNF